MLSRAHAEGRTFYSFPACRPWVDAGWGDLWRIEPMVFVPPPSGIALDLQDRLVRLGLIEVFGIPADMKWGR